MRTIARLIHTTRGARVIGLGALWCVLASASAEAQGLRRHDITGRDSAGVRRLVASIDSAWTARAAEALAARFDADADVIFWGTPLQVRGRAAVQRGFAARLASAPSDARHVTAIQRFFPVAPDRMLVDAVASVVSRDASGVLRIARQWQVAMVLGRAGKRDWTVRVLRAAPVDVTAERVALLAEAMR